MNDVTLFSYISPEEQERMRICFCMREVVYQNNETIMEYASSMKKIGLILEGQAVLYCCDEDGNQYMMDELKKDSVFGEPFLLPEESLHYYVCAKTKTRVLFIDYEHVIKRCENACRFHSQLVSNLLQMIAMRASQQASRIYVLSRTSTRRKILAYLNSVEAAASETSAKKTTDAKVSAPETSVRKTPDVKASTSGAVSKSFKLPMSYTMLAEYLSVDRSAMMRELKNLTEEGIIERQGRFIRLLN